MRRRRNPIKVAAMKATRTHDTDCGEIVKCPHWGLQMKQTGTSGSTIARTRTSLPVSSPPTVRGEETKQVGRSNRRSRGQGWRVQDHFLEKCLNTRHRDLGGEDSVEGAARLGNGVHLCQKRQVREGAETVMRGPGRLFRVVG